MDVKNKADLARIVAKISFGPSGVMLDRMNLKWQIQKFSTGWRLRFAFNRPDTLTGKMGRGYGRWELIERGASVSSVVKTCWLLLELLVRHELMESFQYNGVKLFDPHRTVDELALPSRRVSAGPVWKLGTKVGRTGMLCANCNRPFKDHETKRGPNDEHWCPSER